MLCYLCCAGPSLRPPLAARTGCRRVPLSRRCQMSPGPQPCLAQPRRTLCRGLRVVPSVPSVPLSPSAVPAPCDSTNRCGGITGVGWGRVPAVGLGVGPCRGAAAAVPLPHPTGCPGGAGISSGASPALRLCRCQSPALAHQIGLHPAVPGAASDPPEAAESSHLGRDRGTARPPPAGG